MHLDVACVYHQPFIIRLIDQNFQKFFLNAFSAPMNKSLMNTAPFPVIERQVTPGYSGSQYPKHCVNKPSVILDDSSPLASLSWQMGFKQRPHYLLRCFPFFHNSFTLCRRYLMRELATDNTRKHVIINIQHFTRYLNAIGQIPY